MAKLYEISATAKSGREGKVSTADNQLSLMMGAPSNKAGINNPEQLFACGYASCFSQAMMVITKEMGIMIQEAPITVHVELHKTDAEGFNIMVGVSATLSGIDQSKAKEVMLKTHGLCPYSKLIKPNHFLFLKMNNENVL